MTSVLPAALLRQIDDCGYYPEVVRDSVVRAVGDELVRAHVVHHETTFTAEELLRHLSVLVLTDTRLIISHTDEGAHGPDGQPMFGTQPDGQAAVRGTSAVSSTEAIPLNKIQAVSLTRVISEPSKYSPERSRAAVVETWLTLGWGTMRRLDLDRAACPDPECEADHGYTGTAVSDDLTVRMSPTADGHDHVEQLVGFATALQRAVGR